LPLALKLTFERKGGDDVTSPPEKITVCCPACSERYGSWFRPSVNLSLEPITEEELREMTTATCPACGRVVALDSLVVDGDVWTVAGG